MREILRRGRSVEGWRGAGDGGGIGRGTKLQRARQCSRTYNTTFSISVISAFHLQQLRLQSSDPAIPAPQSVRLSVFRRERSNVPMRGTRGLTAIGMHRESGLESRRC